MGEVGGRGAVSDFGLVECKDGKSHLFPNKSWKGLHRFGLVRRKERPKGWVIDLTARFENAKGPYRVKDFIIDFQITR